MASNEVLEDTIVRQIHEVFNCLPKKCKPRDLQYPSVEWVPLSAIAILYSNGDVKVLSLGTGMKCLPVEAVPSANGIVLHDWHAETVAIRAFNRFLVDECRKLASENARSSGIIEWREKIDDMQPAQKQQFAIRDDVKIYMYCSQAPCGDASMELVMEAQEDDTPWPRFTDVGDNRTALLGRGSFDELGCVRRKPSRADSPVTLSKSCSDKIALKQCMSLLSGPTSLLIYPTNAYIDTLIIPKSQYRASACERAFGLLGRLHPLANRYWLGGYSFRPFHVKATEIDFLYSRSSRETRVVGSRECPTKHVTKGSNISAVWSAQSPTMDLAGSHLSQNGMILNERSPEALIKGRLQGWKDADPRGASKVSRKDMWQSVAEVLSILSVPVEDFRTYKELKLSNMLAERRLVKIEATKEALHGWIPNKMDNFELHQRRL